MRRFTMTSALAAWLVLGSSAPASNRPQFSEFPISFVLSGVCVGQEDIAITGTEYMKFHQFIDANGGLHFSSLFGFRGDAAGVGLNTGIRYQLVGSGVGTEFYSSTLPVTLTHQVRLNFVGPGPANNIQAYETANIKINGKGEVAVFITEAVFRCPD